MNQRCMSLFARFEDGATLHGVDLNPSGMLSGLTPEGTKAGFVGYRNLYISSNAIKGLLSRVSSLLNLWNIFMFGHVFFIDGVL